MKHVSSTTERDRAVILNVVRRFGPISRVQIHELTEMRQTSISQLTRLLIDQGQLVKTGLADNPMGRKQILLDINKESSFILSIDFDAEKASAAVTDLHPRILKIRSEPTCLDQGANGLLEQLARLGREVLADAQISPNDLSGIGIGDPGLSDSRSGISILSSTIDFWRDIPTRKFFEEVFGVPAILGNNTRCKALSEFVLSGAEMPENVAYIEYTRGIGSALIVGGKVLEGHHWSAGEFGHTRISDGGPPCRCGSFGCLEALAGASAVEGRIRSILLAGGTSRASSLVDGKIDDITTWTVFEAARQGDKVCRTIIEDVGRNLGFGLANLVNLFDPALIVLDKHLELAGPELLDQIVRTVKMQSLAHNCEDLEFRFAKFGEDAGILGAALMVLERLFEIPALRPPKFLIDEARAPKNARAQAYSSSMTASTLNSVSGHR